MYADKITESMQQTIDETSRRRAIQLAYNEEHGITPQAIVKARSALIGLDRDEHASGRSNAGQHKKKSAEAIPYAEEYSTTVNVAADPVIGYLNAEQLQKVITQKRSEMVEAAKKMEFIEAARLRDEVLKLEDLMKIKTEEEINS